MRDRDLADYLDHDPFLEHPEPQCPLRSSGDASPPTGRVPQPKVLAQSDDMSEPQLLTPGTPEPPTRSVIFARDTHAREVLQMVMSIFTGARWTTREAYTRAAAQRDRKGRKTRG
jgi:hypothetical protein